MSRYQNSLTPKGDIEGNYNDIEQYLTSEGFKKVTYKGEQVWKKGVGLMLGPQFVKLALNGNQIDMQAWIRFALLPGVYIGEMGIDGIFGLIPKKLLKKRVEEIESRVQG